MPCEHSQVSREHRERGTRTVRTFPRVPWKWNSHDTTVACSIVFEPRPAHIEEKAGRHIDDFLVTGLEPNVERFLAQARDKLNMQDAVRLYQAGDEGRLLAMNFRKLEQEVFVTRQTSSHSRKCPQHSERKAPKQVSYQKPSTRKHRTTTMNHSHQRKHEPSKHVLAKQCTSVTTFQTFSTA